MKILMNFYFKIITKIDRRFENVINFFSFETTLTKWVGIKYKGKYF